MSGVIEDFSAFFKPVNKAKVFSLKDSVNKAINLSSIEFLYQNINIIEDTKKIELKALENEFIQVLINIFTNARDELVRKDMDEKFILISARKREGNIILNIKDNAGGIKEDHITRVFEPYFTTKEESKGTGIGLYMCSEIITKHMKGEIRVRNKEYYYKNKAYKGALFTIILPDNIKT